MEKRNYNNKRNNNSKADNRQPQPMVWTDGVMPSFISNMASRSPFIVCENNGRNDLSGVVIMTQWPFIVARPHRFATDSDQKANPREGLDKDYIRKKADEDRREWLRERNRAFANASNANSMHKTVAELVASLGGTYDEEFDEPRMVAKVPGMNVYLELLGTMDDIQLVDNFYDVAPSGSDVVDIPTLRRALQWMASFFRGHIRKSQRKQYATHKEQIQPIHSWYEEYQEDDCRMFIPRECGIGHDHIDPSRRDPRYPRHPFNEEEKAELARLKAENANRVDPLTPNELQRQAVANVAARHMFFDMDKQ